MTSGAWIPAHSFEHPAFFVLEPSVRKRLLSLDHFPAPHELHELADGLPSAIAPWFDFSPQDQAQLWAAGGFDRWLSRTSSVPTRVGSFHDLLGALIWLHFPALKTALHRAQLAGDELARGPSENAATHLDESGVLVLSTEPTIFESLAALKWCEVFWERRAELLRTTRFLAFGHGLLDALRDPHPRLMGKALFVRVAGDRFELAGSDFRVFLDGALAKILPRFLSEPARLHPLPVLGVPDWSANQSRAYYEDQQYFRPRSTAATRAEHRIFSRARLISVNPKCVAPRRKRRLPAIVWQTRRTGLGTRGARLRRVIRCRKRRTRGSASRHPLRWPRPCHSDASRAWCWTACWLRQTATAQSGRVVSVAERSSGDGSWPAKAESARGSSSSQCRDGTKRSRASGNRLGSMACAVATLLGLAATKAHSLAHSAAKSTTTAGAATLRK